MTLDNCLPLQDPSLLAINGFAVPQTAKLAEKRKLIEEIAHNDVKKVSLELDLMWDVPNSSGPHTDWGEISRTPVIIKLQSIASQKLKLNL